MGIVGEDKTGRVESMENGILVCCSLLSIVHSCDQTVILTFTFHQNKIHFKLRYHKIINFNIMKMFILYINLIHSNTKYCSLFGLLLIFLKIMLDEPNSSIIRKFFLDSSNNYK